jgi:hypothetical protein
MKVPHIPKELATLIRSRVLRVDDAVRIVDDVIKYGTYCFKRGGVGPVGMPVGTCTNCGKKCRACSAELCTNRAYFQHPAGPPAERCPEWKGCDHKRIVLGNHTICSDYDSHCRRKTS